MTDTTDTLYQGDPLREAVKFLLDNMRCDDPMTHQLRERLRRQLDEGKPANAVRGMPVYQQHERMTSNVRPPMEGQQGAYAGAFGQACTTPKAPGAGAGGAE